MTIQDLTNASFFQQIVAGQPERSISKPFCCDLLSIAMSRAPADSAWVTVMGNQNTLAVASLADVACIILAEGVSFRPEEINRAAEEGIAVFETELPIFDAALKVQELL